VHIFLIFCIIE